MSGFTGKFFERVAVADAPLVAPIRQPQMLKVDAPPSDYVSLAKSVGVFNTADVIELRSELMAELAEMGLAPFRLSDVTAYLNKAFKPMDGRSASWGWRPAVQRTYELTQPITLTPSLNNGWLTSNVATGSGVVRFFDSSGLVSSAGSPFITSMGPSTNGERLPDVYAKLIPMPVLHTIQRLQEKFKSRLSFYVSDELHVSDFRDPFLGVWTGEEMIVIEQWDEPGFTGKRQ